MCGVRLRSAARWRSYAARAVAIGSGRSSTLASVAKRRRRQARLQARPALDSGQLRRLRGTAASAPASARPGPARCSPSSASLVRVVRDAGGAGDRAGVDAPGPAGTASSTCRSAAPAGRAAVSGSRGSASTKAPDRARPPRAPPPPRSPAGRPARGSAGAPRPRGARHRPGHAHQPGPAGRPARGVEGAAADGRLDDDGARDRARRSAGCGPGTGSGSVRTRVLPRRRPGRRRRCSRSAPVRRRGRRGRRRRPAPPPSGPRLRQRTPVGGLVDAERRARDDGPGLAGEDVAPMSPATSPPYVVADREPTTATDCSRGLVEPQRATAPQADRHPAALVQVRRVREVVQRRRATPRHRARRTGSPSRAARSSSRAGSTDASRAARSAPSSPVGRLLAQARRAPRRRPARGPGRSAAGRPARRCGTAPPGPAARSRSGPLTPAAQARADARCRSQQRSSPTQPQGHVELLGPGSLHAGQVGHRPRDPVDPHRPAPGEPAGIHLVVEARASPASVSGQRSRSSGPGAWTLSRQGIRRIARAWRSRAAVTRTRMRRWTRARSNGRSGSLAARLQRLDEPGDVDAVGDRARRSCARYSRRFTSLQVHWWSRDVRVVVATGQGLQANTNIARAG